jgi:type IV pilus assembly protein PilC
VLSVPVLGTTIQYALVERFCRILASMVNAGVALPESLRVATESLHNLVFERALAGVAEAMLEGEGLADPLAKTGLLPSTAAQMLRVGEETGTLETQLEVTAQYYESELDYKIKKLTALFEPLVIVVMGLVVGFVAIALVSAMYGVFRQVKV